MRFGIADLRALGDAKAAEIDRGHIDGGDDAAFDVDRTINAAHVEARASAWLDNARAARRGEFPMLQIPRRRPS